MSSRDYILSRAKSSVASCKGLGNLVDPVEYIKKPSGDLLSEFVEKIVENKANIVQCEKDKIVAEIDKIIEKEGVKNLIYPASLADTAKDVKIEAKFEFSVPVEEFKDKIFDFDVSIINARGGVSSHGVVCVASSKDQSRLLSLTPKVCIVLLDKNDIVRSLSDQLNKIKDEDGKIPTNVNFISGPSRTSDIELNLVIGVHGSQIFYTIIY